MRSRFFVLLGAWVLAVSAAPGMPGVAAASATTAQTQKFEGSSTGATPVRAGPGDFHYQGGFTSDGQLGAGHLSIDIGSLGTHARLVRSDGMTLIGTARFDAVCTSPLVDVCVDLNLSGTADVAHADIFLDESLPPVVPNFAQFLMLGSLVANRRLGYIMVTATGDASAFGGVDLQPETFGHSFDPTFSAEKRRSLFISGVVDIAPTPFGDGYWVVNDAGQVYAYGNASYFGGADRDRFVSGQRITSMSPTPTGRGYWLFTSDGRALPFGDATLFGDLSSTPINQPIVGSVATPTGKGYYMVASDGGVFAFGDAKFRGSMGGSHLNQPVVGIVPTADNTGYWLVASDGGVFSFNAPFHGSMGAVALNRPVVTMVPYAGAYLMVASDGGIFNFSHGPFFGSAANHPLTQPIISVAATG